MKDDYLKATDPNRKICAWCSCPIASYKGYMTFDIKKGEDKYKVNICNSHDHPCVEFYLKSTSGKYVENIE